MAKTAARRSAAKPASPAKGGIKPVLLAVGLGLFWFVEYQDSGGASDAPIWAYAMTVAVRVLVDFVGAWVIISAAQLSLAVAKLGVLHLRGLWLQESGR